MRYFRHLAIVLLAVFALANGVLAGSVFPALTGRVVDDAHILSVVDANNLEQILASHEAQTSNQIVVVTVKTLQGLTIEEYGYQLGRNWGIGQKGKNNGVLLIYSPTDKQVRIEVGYGLEGVLTDAVSSMIIQTIILPKFRSKDYAGGINDGVTAIIAVLGGKAVANIPVSPAIPQAASADILGIVFILVFLGILMTVFMLKNRSRRWRDVFEFIMNIIIMIIFRGGGGGRGGGGFSGGGGSFGGGGSSGKG